jgi:hypothetical protein
MDLWDKEASIWGVFQSPYLFPRAIALIEKVRLEDCVKAFEAQMTGKPVKMMFKFS